MVVPKKALFRAAQALIALERWLEAKDVVKRGLEGMEGDKAWKELESKVELGIKRVMERKERQRRDVLSKKALKEAIEVSFSLVYISFCTAKLIHRLEDCWSSIPHLHPTIPRRPTSTRPTCLLYP